MGRLNPEYYARCLRVVLFFVSKHHSHIDHFDHISSIDLRHHPLFYFVFLDYFLACSSTQLTYPQCSFPPPPFVASWSGTKEALRSPFFLPPFIVRTFATFVAIDINQSILPSLFVIHYKNCDRQSLGRKEDCAQGLPRFSLRWRHFCPVSLHFLFHFRYRRFQSDCRTKKKELVLSPPRSIHAHRFALYFNNILCIVFSCVQ